MSAAPGTPSEEIPDDRTCPVCGVGKSNSEEVEAQPGKRGAAPKRSAPRHFG
ncbi:rubredoxin, partial [Alistipes shahii]